MKDYNSARDEAFDFLISLRDSGITNMWGAAPYLYEYFEGEISKKDSEKLLIAWIKSFKSNK